MTTTNSVKELTEERNRIEAEIFSIEKKIVEENHRILYEELCNFFDGCGDGFVSADYYAHSRYYSKISGVKNFRYGDNKFITVKVTAPSGYLLPDEIMVRGEEWKIKFIQSENYNREIDY